MNIRYANERGKSELGWLSSRFSFSFAEYFDKDHIGFGALRVINDDIIMVNGGFGMHSHNNMEIVTIILDGTLRHSDSLGFSKNITTGDIQYMSAGSGIRHSEINPSQNQDYKLLQIWIKPDRAECRPTYEKKHFDSQDFENSFCAIASGFDKPNAIKIRQDATIYRGKFDKGKIIRPNRLGINTGWYLFVIDGCVYIGEHRLQSRDAAMLGSDEILEINTDKTSDLLLFEVTLEQGR